VARISKITKRIALGCIPLAALVILTPKPQASAQFDIFSTVLGTVTGMGVDQAVQRRHRGDTEPSEAGFVPRSRFQ
jgi:glucokinase